LEALKAMGGPDREEGQPKNLRVRLIDASNGNIDALADISPTTPSSTRAVTSRPT
jgi:hypothetical protein